MTICTPWRVGNSLNKLLDQVNAKAPHRSKVSDGSIGDAAHQTEACSSQHNSCCVRFAGVWIVRARDFTHDPAGGFDSYAFAELLRIGRDPRIRYVISNRRITGPNYGWVWHPYTGTSDPHTNHAHVSVWDTQALYDNTADWKLWEAELATPNLKGDLMADIFTVLDTPPAGAVDVLGTKIVKSARVRCTGKGIFVHEYEEIIDFYNANGKETSMIPMTYARLLAYCNVLAEPPAQVDAHAVAAEVAAALAADPSNPLTESDIPAVAEAVAEELKARLAA